MKIKIGIKGGIVIINGDVDIYGMVGFVDGIGLKVDLKGIGNKVLIGIDGVLVVKNGGVINFGGGIIIYKNNGIVVGKNDYESLVFFYVDNNLKINFEGDGINLSRIIIEMVDGVLMLEEVIVYNGLNDGKVKYNGMKNVIVKFIGDNVILKILIGKDIIWIGVLGLVVSLKSDMKLGGFDLGIYKYKVYYFNGIFKIDINIDLDDFKIVFYNVGLFNEMVIINIGREIKLVIGKGLVVVFNKNVIINVFLGYINKGNINIIGGSLVFGIIGLNVSYGIVRNEKNINVVNGIGVYGINGSKFVNEIFGKINIGI